MSSPIGDVRRAALDLWVTPWWQFRKRRQLRRTLDALIQTHGASLGWGGNNGES